MEQTKMPALLTLIALFLILATPYGCLAMADLAGEPLLDLSSS